MKKFLIYGSAVILIISVIWAIVWGPQTYDFYRQNFLQQKILGEVKTLEDSYKNDPYGGATPEETLQGFISALKAGDTETAANYFVPEKRGEYKTAINNWKNNNKLDSIIKYLMGASGGKEYLSGQYQIPITDENNNVGVVININKNKFTGKWLIESL